MGISAAHAIDLSPSHVRDLIRGYPWETKAKTPVVERPNKESPTDGREAQHEHDILYSSAVDHSDWSGEPVICSGLYERGAPG